jgi:hypothetical protein
MQNIEKLESNGKAMSIRNIPNILTMSFSYLSIRDKPSYGLFNLWAFSMQDIMSTTVKQGRAGQEKGEHTTPLGKRRSTPNPPT